MMMMMIIIIITKKRKAEQGTYSTKNYACVYFCYSARLAFELQLMDNGQEETFVLTGTQKIMSISPS
jgi:hypothetical protein